MKSDNKTKSLCLLGFGLSGLLAVAPVLLGKLGEASIVRATWSVVLSGILWTAAAKWLQVPRNLRNRSASSVVVPVAAFVAIAGCMLSLIALTVASMLPPQTIPPKFEIAFHLAVLVLIARQCLTLFLAAAASADAASPTIYPSPSELAGKVERAMAQLAGKAELAQLRTSLRTIREQLTYSLPDTEHLDSSVEYAEFTGEMLDLLGQIDEADASGDWGVAPELLTLSKRLEAEVPYLARELSRL